MRLGSLYNKMGSSPRLGSSPQLGSDPRLGSSPRLEQLQVLTGHLCVLPVVFIAPRQQRVHVGGHMKSPKKKKTPNPQTGYNVTPLL